MTGPLHLGPEGGPTGFQGRLQTEIRGLRLPDGVHIIYLPLRDALISITGCDISAPVGQPVVRFRGTASPWDGYLFGSQTIVLKHSYVHDAATGFHMEATYGRGDVVLEHNTFLRLKLGLHLAQSDMSFANYALFVRNNIVASSEKGIDWAYNVRMDIRNNVFFGNGSNFAVQTSPLAPEQLYFDPEIKGALPIPKASSHAKRAAIRGDLPMIEKSAALRDFALDVDYFGVKRPTPSTIGAFEATTQDR